jgi:HK97 family phage portal protein
MPFKNPFARTPVETKAINLNYSGQVSSIQATFPSYTPIADDSISVIQYQRGYAAACINLISKAVGQLPYYLYRVESAETGKYAGKSVKVPSKRLDRRVSKSIAKGDYTLAKIYEHPFLDLLETDTDLSTSEMLGLITGYLLTIGNAYIKVERDGGTVTKLKLLMSEFVSLKYDANYKITEYVYAPQLSGYTTEKLSPADVIHIARKVPGSVIAGRGVLEDCMVTVSVAEEAKAFTYALLKNHMTPSQNVVVKNAMKDDTEAERVFNKLKAQYSGENRGKAIVTFGDVTITDGGTKMRDQTVLELAEYCKTEITALFGVPVDLLDQGDSNRASITAAKNNLLSMTVFPIASSICDQITKFIANEYDTSFVLGFDTDEATETDPVEQATLFKTYIDAGIMTKDEARAKLGMEPLTPPVKETL